MAETEKAEDIPPPSSSNQENEEDAVVAKTCKKSGADKKKKAPPPLSNRPKRKAAQNVRNSARAKSKVKPSSSMYVGYVEEDETPEMIMAKFAELERIQQMHKEKQEQLKLEK